MMRKNTLFRFAVGITLLAIIFATAFIGAWAVLIGIAASVWFWLGSLNNEQKPDWGEK